MRGMILKRTTSLISRQALNSVHMQSNIQAHGRWYLIAIDMSHSGDGAISERKWWRIKTVPNSTGCSDVCHLFLCFFPNFFFVLERSLLTNNAGIVSSEQGRDLAIHLPVSILPNPLNQAPHNIQQSSMCIQ